MKVLGLESSGKVAGLAIVEGSEVIAEFSLNAGITHSQTFLPLLDQMLRHSGTRLEDIDRIAVSQGPGSYTGLRIGIATAKGLALPTDKEIVPVSTLAGLAYNIADEETIIFPLLFARTTELYYAQYRSEKGELTEVEAPQVLLLEEALQRIKQVQEGGERTALVGDGFFRFEKQFRENLPSRQFFVPMRRRHQLSAASIALLGEKRTAGCGISGRELVPVYLKKTQAERECGQE